MASKWIKSAVSNKGALHRHLGVPEGETIPEHKLRAAANSKNGKVRKEAQLAMTLKGFHPKADAKHVKPSGIMKKMYGGKKTAEKE